MRTVFTSNTSFQEAILKAQEAGFRIVGQVRNPKGQFVVFGERNDNQIINNNRSVLDSSWLRGKI